MPQLCGRTKGVNMMNNLSIFQNGLTTKAYQTATKKRSPKTRTNNDWFIGNQSKLDEMRSSKEEIFNNIVRKNLTSVEGRNIFFRLLGLKNRTLTLEIEGEKMNVIPCDNYQTAIQAYETSLELYQDDEGFRGSINSQLEKQGAVIEALVGGV